MRVLATVGWLLEGFGANSAVHHLLVAEHLFKLYTTSVILTALVNYQYSVGRI